ncbi:MAG: glycosyltransferase family A protein [Desertimonas sp.]
MTGGPAISAIVLTYNQARYVPDCLSALVAQTFGDWELVIADDASRDGALGVATGWAADHGIVPVVVAQPINAGLCATLNAAVARSSGRYLAITAADDRWLPDKFADQAAWLDEHPDVAVVYTDMASMDDDGVVDPTRVWRTSGHSGHLFDELLDGTMIGTATTLIRRSALAAIGGFDESLVFEDWDAWLRLADRYEFAYHPRVSAVYRERPDSMSAGSEFRVEILRSTVRLLSKWIGRSRRTDRRIAASLSRVGWRLAPHDPPAGRAAMWRACRLAPSRANLGRLARSLIAVR